MPPLIILSPRVLDHSFPRSDLELTTVVKALGQLHLVLAEGAGVVAVTSCFRELVLEEFCWESAEPLHREVFRFLEQLMLYSGEQSIFIDTSVATGHVAHPLPSGLAPEGLVEFWQDEVGRLLVLHDSCAVSRERFFCGVACESAFSGGAVGGYDATEGRRVFPILGPTGFRELEDSFEWEVSADLLRKPVSFENAKKNIGVLGAIEVRKPRRGSHFKVSFRSTRSWVLDSNVDPVPARFLAQLCPISGFPLPVVMHALLVGQLPPRRPRLARLGACPSAAN